MEELIKALEELQQHHERMIGVQKMGIASHFWNGRAEGVKDCLKIIKDLHPSQE